MSIDFLLQHFPTRFALSEDGRTVRTLSAGYEHSFALDEWAETPLKLLGLLIQEDCYLLEEQELPTEEGGLPPLPQRKESSPFQEYSFRDHIEEHPGGKQHIFLSAVSTFSFEAGSRHHRSMASIHNPCVSTPTQYSLCLSAHGELTAWALRTGMSTAGTSTCSEG